jgi:hypothetical protein
MSIFGKKKTAPPALPAQEVIAKLLELNRPSAPYRIMDGASHGVDLIAEWKIVDAEWYQIFAKARLEKVFQIRMKLDEAKHQVRAKDYEYTIEWEAGIPSLSLVVSGFQGQTASVQFGTAYAFTEELKPGQVYKYRFSTNEIKTPVKNIIAACGWKYKGIAFGKL